MKICPNCNTQYDDSVSFCSVCGSTLVNAPVPPKAPAANGNKLYTLMSFIEKLVAIFALFFAACSIVICELDINVYYSSYSGNLNSYGYLETEPACAVLSVLFALSVLGLAVFNFIQIIVKKMGKEALFSGICRLTGYTMLTVFTFILCGLMA